MCCLAYVAKGQDSLVATDHAGEIKVIIATPDQSSDSVIAVPPVSSVSFSVNLAGKSAANQKSDDLVTWLSKESVANGLASADLHPWHIVIAYDQFDEDGDNIHSGTFEEYWVGSRKYKISYKSDDLNQTDYATDKGLFRLGDQRWPNPAEIQVRAEVVDPFHYAATLEGVHTRNIERTFGTHSLDCVLLENSPGKFTAPTQYCFDHGGSALRYSWGYGWDQIAYNNVVPFQGSNIAQEVEVTHSGKPYLRLHVKVIEPIAQINEQDFTPPPDAVALNSQRVTGVSLRPLKTFIEWPDSLREQQFKVTVEIVIGKDGHVTSAHAVSGPSNAYKSAENSAKKWIFQPYLILGEPVEVDAKIVLSNN